MKDSKIIDSINKDTEALILAAQIRGRWLTGSVRCPSCWISCPNWNESLGRTW